MGIETAVVRVGDVEISLESGRMARQADGACVVRQGETIVLVTATAAPEPAAHLSFFPLTVEFREGFAASGRIPPWQNRRDGRTSDQEILTSRLIDRAIRPLFPKGFRNETQVIATVLSSDPEIEAGPLALLGASAALHLSDIPWEGPVAAARFLELGSRFVSFERMSAMERATAHFVVAVGPEGLLMVEGEAREIAEESVVELLADVPSRLQPLLDAQYTLREKMGRPKRPVPKVMDEPSGDLRAVIDDALGRERDALANALCTPDKRARALAVRDSRVRVMAAVSELGAEGSETHAKTAFASEQKRLARELILDGRRADGRSLDAVRPISIELGVLPRAHGSALFTRGETQAIVSATLGAPGDRLRVVSPAGESQKRFFLHYAFPPFSVGEVRPLRGPGRREVGHGMLAERALLAVLPDDERFPYTVRIASEILESNGSSSMATVCGGCLAMMDAGVPVTSPVAGVAMGLVKEGARAAVLTDILGDEDHLGDMDFKVCGTAQGVTALQMDIKVTGLDRELLSRALVQARAARLHVLAEMTRAIAAPRSSVAARAPRLVAVRVRPERVREIIGPGGSTIRALMEESGARIDVNNDGLVQVSAPGEREAQRALARIERLVHVPRVGNIYSALLRRVMERLAIVELAPGQEGVLHISEYAAEHTPRLDTLLNEGQRLQVCVVGVDPKGRVSVSRKAALDADPTEVLDYHAPL